MFQVISLDVAILIILITWDGSKIYMSNKALTYLGVRAMSTTAKKHSSVSED